MSNLDQKTVASFGDEWSRFDQSGMDDKDLDAGFRQYFLIFPWNSLPLDAEGFDMGCGSGRWARLVAGHVGKLHCIDPSAALAVARRRLADLPNVEFHQASVDDPGLAQESQDFGYSLGVLHHVPHTAAAIRDCVKLLKPGAPLLLYLYYAFDQRPAWFRALWRLSDLIRRFICCLPAPAKHVLTDLIAMTVYWPLSRGASLLEWLGMDVEGLPLSFYRHHGLYTLRTDARDRFGTPLEQRFTKSQIEEMMIDAGLQDIRFSTEPPYWCAVGIKA
jgi:SAM-dependent methyltransferase